MGRVLLYIYPTFSEFEITIATAVLRKDYEIHTCATRLETVIGESGLQFQPHIALAQVNVQDYEAIIIPGGDLIHIKDDVELFELVREFNKKTKLIAAICSGPFVLGKADLLKERAYTCTLTREQRSFLGGFPEESYRYEKVVQSGNLLTAQGHAYVDFGLKILDLLKGSVSTGLSDFYYGIRNRLMEQDQEHRSGGIEGE